MPVASTIAAVAGTVASVSAGAATLKQIGVLGGGGKKQAAAAQANQAAQADAGKWGDRFSGIMAGTSKSVDTNAVDNVNKQGSGPLGGLTRENLGSLAEKYPENPAYKLALKADDIFKPEITQVMS